MEDDSLLHRTAIAVCLGTGLFFAFRAATPDAQALNTVLPDVKTVEPISASVELVTQNIEDIRLGQRVVGTNPLREQTQAASDIDPATWRAVRLNMTQGGVDYDLAFLRPISWLKAIGPVVGGSIHMELHEMGLNGPAQSLGGNDAISGYQSDASKSDRHYRDVRQRTHLDEFRWRLGLQRSIGRSESQTGNETLRPRVVDDRQSHV